MFYFRSGNYATERQYYVYTMESFVADVGGYLVVCGTTMRLVKKFIAICRFLFNCELVH